MEAAYKILHFLFLTSGKNSLLSGKSQGILMCEPCGNPALYHYRTEDKAVTLNVRYLEVIMPSSIMSSSNGIADGSDHDILYHSTTSMIGQSWNWNQHLNVSLQQPGWPSWQCSVDTTAAGSGLINSQCQWQWKFCIYFVKYRIWF